MKLIATKGYRLLSPKLALCLIACSVVHSAGADVVFDGSIGSLPAGTLRSGDFIIGESDGQLSGTNLFHSFERFNVNTGESATFSHTTPNVLNIISRVTGDTGTLIQGELNVAQDSGGTLSPSFASLWLINPSGIVIGEGAALNSNGAFRLSSANEIGFSNGDAFFSHDVTNNSTLSFADPMAFGFLSGDILPDSVTPGTVVVEPISNDVSAFAFDLALVGTNADPEATGLRIGPEVSSDNDAFGPGVSLTSSRVVLHSLGAEGTVLITPPGDPGDINGVSTGSGVEINNTNIFSSDFGLLMPPSILTITGENVSLNNSAIASRSNATSQSLLIGSINQTSITNSSVSTSTISSLNAGDLLITGNSIVSSNSAIGSSATQLDGVDQPTTFGNAGNITLSSSDGGITLFNPDISSVSFLQSGSGNILIQSTGDISLAGDQPASGILNFSSSNEAGGDIEISSAGALSISGNFTASATALATGPTGNISLSGESVSIAGLEADQRINVSASATEEGSAGEVSIVSNQTLALTNTDVFVLSANQAGGVTLQAGNIVLADTSLSASTISDNPLDAPGTIVVNSTGDLSANAVDIGSNTSGLAPAGLITIDAGGSIQFSDTRVTAGTVSETAAGPAGDIAITADGNLTLEGNALFISSNSQFSGDAGDISLTAQDITLGQGYTIQSAADAGDAGDIVLNADRIFGGSGQIGIFSETGGGGNLSLLAREIRLLGNMGEPAFYSADSFAAGDGGSITLGDEANPAELVLVNLSAFTATAEQGDGGNINVNADIFLPSATSIFTASSNAGTDGALNINATQQDISASVVELTVPLLDQTDLIQDLCSKGASNRSTLVLAESDAQLSTPDGYFSSSTQNPPEIAADAKLTRSLGCAQ